MCTGGHVDTTHPSTSKAAYRPDNLRTSDADTKQESPSKSPLKKKFRRIVERVGNPRRRLIDLEYDAAVACAGGDAGADHDDDDSSSFNNKSEDDDKSYESFEDEDKQQEEGGGSRIKSTSNTLLLDSSVIESPISIGAFTVLEEENFRLQERIFQLLAQVEFLREENDLLLADKKSTLPNKDNEGDDDDVQTSKRSRIRNENAALSREFSKIVQDFVDSPQSANRRYMDPKCRIEP
jgi:hypothetical protein